MWYSKKDRSTAEEVLGLLEDQIVNSSLPEFKELLYTFTSWRDEILNSFGYRITNGIVEGKITGLRP